MVGPFKDDIPGRQSVSVLRLVQHVQAVAGDRPQVARRTRGRTAIVALGRRVPRLVHRRHHGRSRARLRRRTGDQSRHHHGEHLPDGPDRTGRRARRLRLPRRGHLGVLRGHRLGRPAAGRPVQRVHGHDCAALPRRDVDGGARPSPAHGGGPIRRPGADGVVALLPRARAARLSGQRAHAAAQRQRRARCRAARRLPVRRRGRMVRNRHRDRRAVAGATPRARRPGVGGGARVRDACRTARAARPDRSRAHRVHGTTRTARADGTLCRPPACPQAWCSDRAI